jgi:predicted  nucleic acid-binding Zn-ribbon protein
MTTDQNNIVQLGSGDFLIEVKNTNLMEWEGVQIHTYLTNYLNKITEKNNLSPLNTAHVKTIIQLNQELIDYNNKIKKIEERLVNISDKNARARLEQEMEQIIKSSNNVSKDIIDSTKSYYSDNDLQKQDLIIQKEYQKQSPDLMKEIYGLKQEILTMFLRSKNYSNIEDILKNSTAGQTDKLISAIVKNEENNLGQDFFQLVLPLTKQ